MNLILTLDYELYGDGSGDVFEHMVKPTDKILKICDEHNIKITLFFEVLEYIKLKEQWEAGNSMGYKENPIEAIEKQLQTMALNGHDIQLHVHPQWVNAKWQDDRWVVDLDNWRLGDFKVEQDYSIEDMLRQGKLAIEGIVQKVKPDYKCSILRAGGYNILPSKEVSVAMNKLELTIDSSVYPGGYEQGALSKFDFRNAPIDKDFWQVKPENFSLESASSAILEVPIFSLPQIRLKKINIQRIKSALQNRSSAFSDLGAKVEQRSFFQKVWYFFEKESFTWDFCLFNPSLHKTFFKYIQKNLSNKRNTFVLIGHPKGFTGEASLRSLISLASKNNCSFITLESYCKIITSEVDS